MTMLPADCAAVTAAPPGAPAASALEQFLRGLSVVSMLMTVPQVVVVWVGQDPHIQTALETATNLFRGYAVAQTHIEA